jgi:dihydroflavonol-4-reductase
MRVLVTGATGFIGRHVVRRLVGDGHEVRILARASSDISGLPPGIEVARGELGASGDACAGMDGLIHLAGTSGQILRRGDPGRELRKLNVEDTGALFAAAAAAGVRRGVLITSMWSVLRPELADVSPYVRSRIDSEHAALAVPMETVILCPSFVVGPGDRGPNLPGAVVLGFLRRRIPVAPPRGSTWIAVGDAVGSICAALARGRPGARYILGAEYLTYREVGAVVRELAGRSGSPWTAPWGLVKAGGVVTDAALSVFGRRMPIPMGVGTELLCQAEPIDCSESWKDLWAPRVPVRDAIQEAVDWFVAHGYV